jgi:hypothetical protein
VFNKEHIFKAGSAGFCRHTRFVSSSKIVDRLQSGAVEASDTIP